MCAWEIEQGCARPGNVAALSDPADPAGLTALAVPTRLLTSALVRREAQLEEVAASGLLSSVFSPPRPAPPAPALTASTPFLRPQPARVF